MSLSASMNIHGVKRIRLEPEREHRNALDLYATRTIIVETDQGTIEISLFSAHRELGDDQLCMETIV